MKKLHYVNLLNMYDGGKRIEFNSSEEWIDRLLEIGVIEEDE